MSFEVRTANDIFVAAFDHRHAAEAFVNLRKFLKLEIVELLPEPLTPVAPVDNLENAPTEPLHENK